MKTLPLGPYARTTGHDADWLALLLEWVPLLVVIGFLALALFVGLMLTRLESPNRLALRDFQAAQHRMEVAH